MGIRIGCFLVGKQVPVWSWKVLFAQRELAVKSWPEVQDDPMEVNENASEQTASTSQG